MPNSHALAATKGFIELVGFLEQKTSSLASMGSETHDLDPPAGFAYRLMWFDMWSMNPPGSSLGSHSFSLKSNLAVMGANRINVSYAHTADMEFDKGLWQNSPTSIDPETAGHGLLIIPQIWGNSGEPIRFTYTNNTDVAQTNQRRYRGQYAIYGV